MTDKEIEVIVKPIFTKMFNAKFSACEYGIECYKKGMEYQGIKELAIENDNLIKRVKRLELQNEKMQEKLKAGRPKWHDLRKDPNDLPESSIFHEVLNQNGTKVFYDDVSKKWNMYCGAIVQAQTPIAWCEIPKYTKE